MFHYLRFRAFAHETEDPAKVLAALRTAAQDEDTSVEETRVEGSHGNRILILEGEVRSAAAQRRVFAALERDDPAGYATLARTLRKRLDENQNLHWRLDKQKAARGQIVLAQDDDAIVVRAKLRSFGPERKASGFEASLQRLEALLQAPGRGRRTLGE